MEELFQICLKCHKIRWFLELADQQSATIYRTIVQISSIVVHRKTCNTHNTPFLPFTIRWWEGSAFPAHRPRHKFKERWIRICTKVNLPNSSRWASRTRLATYKFWEKWRAMWIELLKNCALSDRLLLSSYGINKHFNNSYIYFL